MAYKPTRQELKSYLMITMPNVFEDETGRRFYKDHITVHDLSCPNGRMAAQAIEILIGDLLKGPEYLRKRFGLEIEPPVRFCKRCLRDNPYQAIMPKPDLLRRLEEEEDDFLSQILPAPKPSGLRRERAGGS